MAEIVRCDQCGTTAPREYPYGWYKVEKIGPDTRTFSEHPDRTLHFCRTHHIWEYFNEQIIMRNIQ